MPHSLRVGTNLKSLGDRSIILFVVIIMPRQKLIRWLLMIVDDA